MTDPEKALDLWMPRLVARWRSMRRTRGPEGRLTPDELRQVASGVRRLSHGLTRARKLVGAKYLDDPELLGAYLLYFWPVSYLQARQVLGELPKAPRAVLDLGSGPGPMSMAAFDSGAREVMAADRSEPALQLAGKLASASDLRLSTRVWDPMVDRDLPGEKIGWNAITVGHALNELWADEPDRIERRAALCERLLGMLRKGGSLVLVEPALRDTTRELLALRDRLVGSGYALRAPCLFRGDCPALAKEVDWCHAERGWHPPETLAAIIEAAGLHKEALKMSYLVVAPKTDAWQEPPDGRVFRVVSEHLRGHGRLRALGCGREGRLTLSVMDEVRTPGAQTFAHAGRGDLLRLTDVRETEGGGLRIEEGSGVSVVAKAGQPVPTR